MADDEPVPEQPEIILRRKQIGGVWANYAQVSHSQHEFTIDFVRMDATAPPPGRGIVVARVSMSPLFVTQLIDALQKNWSGYAEKALPKEVHGESAPEPEAADETKEAAASDTSADEGEGNSPGEEVPHEEPETGSEDGERLVPLQEIHAITSGGLRPRHAASSVAPIARLLALPASLPGTASDSPESGAHYLKGH